MLKNKITVTVLVSNEIKIIGKCLQRLEWVDYILIVDSGSNDGTYKIACEYTRNVYRRKLGDDYSKQRNYLLNKVNTDWILVIDADEQLSNGASSIIRNLIQNDSVDGYWFPRRNYINEKTYLKHGYFYPDWQLRLFRNRKNYRYFGKIHEQVQIPKNNTKFIKNIELYHNHQHSKYSTIFSFYRLFPYIKIEAKDLSRSNKSSLQLLIDGKFDILKHFYRSFFKLVGYKDGYNGYRAACIYATYRGIVKFTAILYRWVRI